MVLIPASPNRGRHIGHRQRRTAIAAGLSLIGVTATACSSADDAATAQIVATTTVWADITSQVACGAPVTALVPAGADPHSYEASLRDREMVTGAKVLIANGAGLEASAGSLVDAAVDAGVRHVVVTDHLELISDDDHSDDDHSDDDHSDDDHSDDDHGDGDPHVWLDPVLVIDVLDEIESVLDQAGFETCTADVRSSLTALDGEIADILAVVAASDRTLVTGHDSFAYFAERYDFEVLGAVVPSTSTLAEPSAGELAELTELIEERAVRAIFTDAFETAVDADALADRIGIPVVELATGSTTDGAPTYAAMMTSNARSIAEALS